MRDYQSLRRALVATKQTVVGIIVQYQEILLIYAVRNKRLPQAQVGIELVVRYIFLHFLCFAAIDAAYDFFPAHDENGHETYKIIEALLYPPWV